MVDLLYKSSMFKKMTYQIMKKNMSCLVILLSRTFKQ